MIWEQELANALATVKPVLTIIAAIVVYSIFIFKFYTNVSKKDLFSFNFDSANEIKNVAFRKFLLFIVYLLEHIIVLPVIIFFWFAVMTILIVLMTQNLDAHAVAIISMGMVGAIRVSAYHAEKLSEDLAKLLPFSLLAISLSKFQMITFESLSVVFTEIYNTFFTILYYVGLIILLEIILRITSFIYSKIAGKDEE